MEDKRTKQGRRLSGDLRHLASFPLLLESFPKVRRQELPAAGVVLCGAHVQAHRARVQVNLIPFERKNFLLSPAGVIGERDNRLEVIRKSISEGNKLAMLKKALS